MEVSVRPITVTEELRRQCRKNTAPFVVLIACLYRSGIKKYVRTNRAEKSLAHNKCGTKICRVACANLRSPNNYY
jgi:hypothetical protein